MFLVHYIPCLCYWTVNLHAQCVSFFTIIYMLTGGLQIPSMVGSEETPLAEQVLFYFPCYLFI